ncbi:ABC transporter substrate-binding protein [Acuticoccus sp. MNP-M23]|uniref:ABC transporter substrate-binding protein n=1 Tax=Acuticoccus sp. MNP-M23 TaxID=3072793 RepID=UPI002815ACBD|nr:ABC transporter substrate-binding protein [Acuticoccus sp. MNP-M23]WMS41120.1 ABC transporter substrate-binding protein [Acuticoccus sp. MNP-M23]
MKFCSTQIVAGAALALVAGGVPQAAHAACPIDDTIMFGGLDYGSAAFHTALARTVLEKGYDCKTDVIPGTTLILNQGLARGDVDLLMEVWTANTAQSFLDAEADGKVTRLGATFPDAIEGWFVPRYMVEGENAPAPDLTSVDQLPEYKALFEDPEEPDKGRFYNCVIGWQCEVVNSKKLTAYGLDDDFTNIRPGAGAALEAAVEAAYLREKPVLFYHWAPTWLIGKYDFVMLDEPDYDKAVWDEMMAADTPTEATAYPQTRVVIGANVDFTSKSDALTDFLTAYSTTSAQTSSALAYMRENDASPEEAAEDFLRNSEDVWSTWVPDDVAAKISGSL